MSTNHDKYLAGEPLTDELRALKEGRFAEPAPPWERNGEAAAESSSADPKRPLSRAERVALREMRTGAGWPVLQKLLERITLLDTEHATSLSQVDPLAHREQIAQAWAYITQLKRAHQALNLMVNMELEKMDLEDAHAAHTSL